MNDEQDWTDIDFVIGAVLVQLEELDFLEKMWVLSDVLRNVTWSENVRVMSEEEKEKA